VPHVTRKEVSSTSAAAAQAAADETGATAAISSEMAADVYGLEVLRGGVQDRDDNETRFMVLRRRTGREEGQGDGRVMEAATEATGMETGIEEGMQSPKQQTQKALLIFTVAHHSPGALAAALAVFQRHRLNLASINTRPSGLAPWNYYFIVEVEMGGDDDGAQGAEEVPGYGEEQDKLDGCLEELQGVAERVRRLGRWVVGGR